MTFCHEASCYVITTQDVSPQQGFVDLQWSGILRVARSFLTAQHIASRSQRVLRFWIRNMTSKSKPTAKLHLTAADITAPAPRPVALTPSFDTLPDSAFIREAQLVQSPKRPGAPAPLPFSAPTLWRKVKNKTFPAPHKLSERVTAWRVGEVRAWMTEQAMA